MFFKIIFGKILCQPIANPISNFLFKKNDISSLSDKLYVFTNFIFLIDLLNLKKSATLFFFAFSSVIVTNVSLLKFCFKKSKIFFVEDLHPNKTRFSSLSDL